MASKEVDILKRALEREKLARKQAENILENKSAELYELTKKLEESNTNLASMVKERTSQLKGVFENINDAFIVMDLDGNILKANDAALSLLEITNENHNLNDFVAPSDIRRKTLAFQDLVVEGSISNLEIGFILENDKYKFVQINASLIRNENNIPIAAQGIVRDITNERMNARIITQQNKELDIIFANTSVGIVLVNQGLIKRSNKYFQDLIGYSESELDNMPVAHITHPDDQKDSIHFMQKMDHGHTDNFEIEKKYKTKDNNLVWARTTVNAVRNEVGEMIYQVAIVEDITKLREKTLVLEVLNEVAKSILGKVDTYEIAWEIANKIAKYLGADDCVIYLVDDEKHVLEQVAAYGEKALSQEIKNKITIKIGSGIVGAVAKTGMAEVIYDTRLDNRYIRDDLSRLSEIAVPIIYDGKVIGVIDSEHENEAYYTEAQLITLTNIARLVSMQLFNAINLDQKEKAEKRNYLLLEALKKSNDELQEYAHVVSHDLKSPLRSINALLYWIKEDNHGKLDDVSLTNIGMIESTLESMEELITGVLEYSSISNIKDNDTMVDFNELINEIITEVDFPENFKITVISELPEIKGDRTRFKQLFQNLISNAIKFNNKENGKVDIDVQEKNTHYQFSIKDNGPGIDKKFYDKIFEIFQSLGNSKNSSGIGLSIVKKIIDQYQGDIWLDSEIGKGTTFYFTIKKNYDGNPQL